MVSVTSRVNGSSDQHSLENSLEIFSLLRTNSCCSLIYLFMQHVHTCVTQLFFQCVAKDYRLRKWILVYKNFRRPDL